LTKFKKYDSIIENNNQRGQDGKKAVYQHSGTLLFWELYIYSIHLPGIIMISLYSKAILKKIT